MIRISRIEIKNFKNVTDGVVTLRNGNDFSKGSLLGLYGQNGSGKTALIEALKLLQCVLRGKKVPSSYEKMIRVNCDASSFLFEFYESENDRNQIIRYSFDLTRQIERKDGNGMVEVEESKYVPCICNEILKRKCLSEAKKRNVFTTVAETTEKDEMKLAKNLLNSFSSKANDIDIIVALRNSKLNSKSCLFSSEFMSNIDLNETENGNLLKKLAEFASTHLYVIQNAETGIINLNVVMPFNFFIEQADQSYYGGVILPFDKTANVRVEAVDVVEKTIKNLNIVLSRLVPGLTIDIKRLNENLDKNGNRTVNVVLVSKKNDKDIPLQYESDGIKKIISILGVMIACFNNPSVVLAVDELDSGIFEFLLGELLKVLEEGMAGQMLFTSHNLRALEVMDVKDIMFTTVNPENRYIHMKGVKRTNNLRDTYYREILLDGQDETLYEATYENDISHAFRKAKAE